MIDAPNYPQWDPGVKVYTKLSPGRAFPAKVTDFEPNQTMTWRGGMPLGLFKGVRTFTLTPEKDGATRFAMREEFNGVLLPLIGSSIPDLNSSFEQFAEGLKGRAENAG